MEARLDDILDAAIAEARRVDPWRGDFRGIRNSAKAAIVEAVEGLIEPDEPYAPVDIPTFVDPNDPHQWNLKVFSENQLKARLRQAIKEWQ